MTLKGDNYMAIQVEFSFDDQKMVKKGVRKEDIYYTLKKNFAERGLECTADGKILTFASTGKNEDYGNIWAIIFALIECDWFTDTASSCVFVENDKEEDILSQIPKAKHIMATA